jgi:hypothetical protein
MATCGASDDAVSGDFLMSSLSRFVTSGVTRVDGESLIEGADGVYVADVSQGAVVATGATTARSLAARLGDIVTIEDFGVVDDPNGLYVASNTAAYQAALNAAASVARLRHRAGLSVVTNSLAIPSNVFLELDGFLQLAPGQTANLLQLSGTNIRLSGLGVLDGNVSNQIAAGAAGIGSVLSGVQNIFVEGITIQNWLNWPVNIANAKDVTLFRVKMLNGGNAPEFSVACDNCWFLDCLSDRITGDYGFAFYGGVTNSGLIGCTARNSGAAGVVVLTDGGGGNNSPCQNITITDNIFYNNAAGAVRIAIGGTDTSVIHTGIIIKGNQSFNSVTSTTSSYDYQIENVDGFILSDNISTNAGTSLSSGFVYSFVVSGNVSNGKICTNISRNCGRTGSNGSGIGFAGQAQNVSFSDNLVESPNGLGAFAYDITPGSNNSFSNNKYSGTYGGAPWNGFTPASDTLCYGNQGIADQINSTVSTGSQTNKTPNIDAATNSYGYGSGETMTVQPYYSRMISTTTTTLSAMTISLPTLSLIANGTQRLEIDFYGAVSALTWPTTKISGAALPASVSAGARVILDWHQSTGTWFHSLAV